MAKDNNIKFKLDELPKDNPFVVPEYYFDKLQGQIADKIAATANPAKPAYLFGFLQPKLVPVIAFASIALLVGSIFIFRPFNQSNNITESELASLYQYDAINNASETDLMKELERLTDENTVPADSVKTSNESFSDEVINYLNDDNIDVNTIIDAL